MANVKTNVLALAERCEAATAPDRGLNWACHAAKLGNLRPPRDELDRAPDYTGSIDAALELIPEGARTDDVMKSAISTFWRTNPHFTAATDAQFRAALPLFICAAALRAKAAEKIIQASEK